MADDNDTREPRRPTSGPPGWRVEGQPPQKDEKDQRRRGFTPPGGPRFWWVLVAALALNFFFFQLIAPSGPDRTSVTYSFVRDQLEAGNVEVISSRGQDFQGKFRSEVAYTPPEGSATKVTDFKMTRPAIYDNEQDNRAFGDLLDSKKVSLLGEPIDPPRPFWETLLVGFGPAILLILLFVWFFRRAAGSGGAFGYGKSRAKRYESSEQRTTFADVAGIDEVKLELTEVVDFLKSPDKYLKLGGSIPRGVLLYGPPGTGKTLLARAVAGEAGVPFFSLSASEFVEMFVGVGASRVRDLFTQAKEAAPAIIFIDELDAIGRSRGAGVMGGHEEREQTLNQILTEMDGFSGAEGVIVLAATNRPEILDVALLRPGRFDRRVAVNPPDQAGRLAILKVHTRHMPLADDVDLEGLASSSPGMVGADLKNLANEAALMAARRRHERVQLADFTDALEKILLGAERKIMLSKDERERTAYHESGHALLGMLEPGADTVRKISIIPRGRALGVTFQAPSTDRYGYDATYLRGRIVGALGGRAAEQIVYGNVTTGAESDLETVTRIAKQMVGRWGMSESIGPVSVLPGPNDEPFLLPGTGAGGPSAHTMELVDREVRRIVDECYTEALDKLTANRDKLEALTQALLERETLDEIDAYAVAGVPRPERPELLGASTSVSPDEIPQAD